MSTLLVPTARKAAKASTPTSGTGISTKSLAAPGFSLLELLVVVTIIGIFAAAAVLSMGIVGRDRVLDREAARLQSLIQILQEEALMESRDFGVFFDALGYRFYGYDYDQGMWTAVPEDRVLAPRQLPEGVSMVLMVEDRELRLSSSQAESDEPPEPQIVILSSGEITPFAIEFLRPPNLDGVALEFQFDGSSEKLADAS